MMDGFLIGFSSGMGAALADTMFAAIAAFGLHFINNFLIAYSHLFRIFGGLYLLYLGYSIFATLSFNRSETYQTKKIVNAVVSTFLLTLSNPLTAVGFAVIFAAANLTIATIMQSAYLLLGIFLGSGAWWLILSSVSAFLVKKLQTKQLILINKILGGILFLGGLITIGSTLFI